jgi:DNA-directed RNA polymerase alpha subunit
MKNKILEKDLTYLKLDSKIIEVLNNNNINNINDLWGLTRKDLKNLKISDKDIHNIIVKLQLNGLDLNKRKY